MTLQTVDAYDPDRVPAVGQRAVVLGASMAGLLAARVLADGFDEVVVLEQDSLPTEPEPRRSLPQDSHVHVLLEAGREVLESLFPGYGETLQSHGGVRIDAGRELAYYENGGFLAETTDELPMFCASRPLFELVVRNRLTDHEKISIREDCRFRTYLTDETASTVEGVVFETAGDDRELRADLVVDATGRSSRTPNWLADQGYAAPPTTEVEIDLAYGTAIIDRPADDRRAILVSPTPPQTRGGTAVPIENDRWLVTLFGFHGDHPPGDQAGFQAFAESLPTDEIASLLDQQPWQTESVDRYPFRSSRRRRYETLERFPDGLLVTGDAIASFNPIYGQGMSVAALDALRLHHALADGLRQLPSRFFDRASRHIDTVWSIAVGSDVEYPQTQGPNPLSTRLFNWYLAQLIRAAHSDRQLSTAFIRVLRLEQPPTSLLRPTLLGRVLFPRK